MRVIARLAMGAVAVGRWGGLVDAMPQRGGFVPGPIVPGKNATNTHSSTPSASPYTNTSTSASPSACVNDCVVELPALTAIHWVPKAQIVYTTEITMATVVVQYTTVGNKTYPPRTITRIDEFPEKSLYNVDVNEEGTAVVTWSTVNPDDGYYAYSTLTYPTPFVEYAPSYGWRGVLQTPNKGANPTCATATPKLESNLLPGHPEYPPPKDESSEKGDKFGTSHIPVWVPHNEEPDYSFFSSAFPDVMAFQYCSALPQRKPGGATTYYAEKLVTVTTTTYVPLGSTDRFFPLPTVTGWDDDGNIVPVPNPPARKPTYAPPPYEPHILTSDENPPFTWTGEASIFPQFPQPSASGWEDDLPPMPIITRTPKPNPPNTPNQPQQQNQGPNPNPDRTERAQPAPTSALTPIFTLIPTTISGTPTHIPAFLLPDTPTPRTLPLGATLTLSNGETTILTAPPVFFTYLPTTLNGETTEIPGYLIDGTSRASLGQLITMANGESGVLVSPTGEGGSWSTVTTTANGIATEIPVYVVSGRTTVYEESETSEETGTAGEVRTGTGFARPEETEAGNKGDAAARVGSGHGILVGVVLSCVSFLWT